MADIPLYKSDAPIYRPQMEDAVRPEDFKAPKGKAATEVLKDPTGRTVNLVTPDGKTVVSVDEAYLQDHLQQGYTVESDQHASLRKYVESADILDKLGGVTAPSFLDAATFGVAGPLIRKLESSDSPEDQAKLAALRSAYSGYGTAGTIAGAITGLGLGGPIFKGASKVGSAVKGAVAGTEATLGTKVAAGALGGAAEGIVLAAPAAATEATLGDPKRAAETLAFGAGVGVALGAVGPIWGAAKSKVLGNSTVAESLENYSSSKAVDALHMPEKYGKRLLETAEAKEAGDFLRKEVKLGLADDTAEAAKKLGKKVEELHDDYGRLMKSDWMEAKAASISEVELESALQKSTKGIKGDLKGELDDVVSDITKSAKPVDGMYSADQLHQLMGKVNGAIEWGGKSAKANEVLADIRDGIQKTLDSYVEARIAGTGGFPVIPAGEATAFADVSKKLRMASAMEAGAGLAVAPEGTVGTWAASHLGGAAGGIAGAAAGSGWAGYHLGRAVGPKVFGALGGAKSALSAPAGRAISKIAGGLAGIADRMAGTAEALEEVPKALALAADNKGPSDGGPLSSENVSSLLFAKGDEKVKKFNQLSETITSLSTNPAKMKQMLDGLVSPYIEEAPDVMAAYSDKMVQIIQDLNANLPKPPNPQEPLAPKREFKPNDIEMNKFVRRIQVAQNPFVLVKWANQGSLTEADVAAARLYYPNTLSDIANRIVSHASSGKAKPLPYSKRMKFQLLMGSEQSKVNYYQGIYASSAAAEEANGQEEPAGINMRPGGGLMTETQRVGAK